DEQLALGGARALALLLVDDSRLEPAARPSERAGRDLARFLDVGVEATGLGHAPDLDDREAEALLEGFVQLGLDPRAEPEADTVRALVRRRRQVEQQRRHHPQV